MGGVFDGGERATISRLFGGAVCMFLHIFTLSLIGFDFVAVPAGHVL